MATLNDTQRKIANKLKDAHKNFGSIIIEPNVSHMFFIEGETGSGKTFTCNHTLFDEILEPGKSGWFICSETDVCRQEQQDLSEYYKEQIANGEVAVICSLGLTSDKFWSKVSLNAGSRKKLIVIATIQWLRNFVENQCENSNENFIRICQPSFIWIDEADRIRVMPENSKADAGQYRREFKASWAKNFHVFSRNIFTLGTTATPTDSMDRGLFEDKNLGIEIVTNNLGRIGVEVDRKLACVFYCFSKTPEAAVEVCLESMNWRKEKIKSLWKQMEWDFIDAVHRVVPYVSSCDPIPKIKAMAITTNRRSWEWCVSNIIEPSKKYSLVLDHLCPDSRESGFPEIDVQKNYNYYVDPYGGLDAVITKTTYIRGVNMPPCKFVILCKAHDLREEATQPIIQALGRGARQALRYTIKEFQNFLGRKLTRDEILLWILYNSNEVHAEDSTPNRTAVNHIAESDTYYSSQQIFYNSVCDPSIKDKIETHIEKLVNEFSVMADKWFEGNTLETTWIKRDCRKYQDSVRAQLLSDNKQANNNRLMCEVSKKISNEIILQAAHIVPHKDIKNDKLRVDESEPNVYVLMTSNAHNLYDRFFYTIDAKGNIRYGNITETDKDILESEGIIDGAKVQRWKRLNTKALEIQSEMFDKYWKSENEQPIHLC